jgi:signal transduction histidine kinase
VISEQASERTGTLSAVRLVRFLWAFSVVLVAFGAVLLVLNRNVEDPVAPYWLNLTATAFALSTVGALVASRQPENPIGWLLVSSGLVYAVMVSVGEYGTYALITENGSPPGGIVATWLGSWLYVLGAYLLIYSFMFFPDGRLPSPRWRVVAWLAALAFCLDTAALALTPGTLYGYHGFENPFGVEALAGLGMIGPLTNVLALAAILAPVIALIVRFRSSRGNERAQIKWVVYAIAVLVTAIIAVNFWPELDPSLVGRVLFLAGFVAVPAAIGIAILKHRLFDIDLIINRTLVYVALTAVIIAIYVLIVGYLGAVLQTGSNLAISLAATGVVAVLFQPLRDRLQRYVNRLMYGERDDPYAVISRLGERLETALDPNAVLPTLVETVREALKLPYAAIALRRGSTSEISASAGEPVTNPLRLPLRYGNEPVGELLLGYRAGEEGFSDADQRLFGDLARQAGVAVHAVRLTADLQRSRERLVTAREEERRRLRRDLHDGLGAQLAGLNVQAGVLRRLIPHDPEAADGLVVELREELRAAIGDIRRLVYDLRPPALDDLGLSGALDRLAERYGAEGDGLRVQVETPEQLPPLPAAVEVAVYRIAQEALTNVVRHARAGECIVRLATAEKGWLRMEITDDGVGIAKEHDTGVGLLSMRERAAELGGDCAVESPAAGGTRLLVRLPLVEE